VRALALLAAAALALAALAQQPETAAPRKKPAANQVAHKKPTPQQLRKFDELEKKHEAKKPERKREPK
jgi:hypothetical protein